MISPAGRLRAVKVVHTIVWAFFAGCILAIPVAAFRDSYGLALALAGLLYTLGKWRGWVP